MTLSRALAAAAVAVVLVLVTPRSLSSPEEAAEPASVAEAPSEPASTGLDASVAPAPASPSGAQGRKPSGSPWRTDRAWHDGKAEKAVYAATDTIYGKERRYEARAYTNKQKMDPTTRVKSAGDHGVEMFKHHWSERVPTERYDYDFSTVVFLSTDDLAAAKIVAATQEDCGASYKEGWREGNVLRWLDSVYFPGAGMREGTLREAAGVAFADDLALRLRDYPFDAPRDVALSVLPSQRSTKRVLWIPDRRTVRYVGRETLDLPIGRTPSHHLALLDAKGGKVADYWFHADGAAPLLHVLVRYEDATRSLRLASHERTAYWER